MTDKAVLLFGASGLIGHALSRRLLAEGVRLRAVARRFTAQQQDALGPAATTAAALDLSADEIARLLRENAVDTIVNCVGVLQDSPSASTTATHEGFVRTLLEGMEKAGQPVLLVHISMTGGAESDATPFSRSKRAADALIRESRLPHVILRPGFVLASAAYGGSALLRSLAMSPFGLPPALNARPFALTAMQDIEDTLLLALARWRDRGEALRAVWDIGSPRPTTLGEVLTAFARHWGGPPRRLPVPAPLLTLAGRLGDAASLLGWQPPLRSTALAELRRGVSVDPAGWMAQTGLAPRDLAAALSAVPSTVQERWFARLYLLKPLLLVTLVAFWAVSGLIALTVAFKPAMAILTGHGFDAPLARAITVLSSLMDISVGCAIALRRTARAGLIAGIAVSLGYMAGAAVLTPELWIEPLGALVKTGPAVVLMLVALAVMESR